jgi:hypothetical protein
MFVHSVTSAGRLVLYASGSVALTSLSSAFIAAVTIETALERCYKSSQAITTPYHMFIYHSKMIYSRTRTICLYVYKGLKRKLWLTGNIICYGKTEEENCNF